MGTCEVNGVTCWSTKSGCRNQQHTILSMHRKCPTLCVSHQSYPKRYFKWISASILHHFTTIHPLRWGGSRVLFFSGDQLWRRLHWESAFWFLQRCGNWAKCIFFWMVEMAVTSLFVFLFFLLYILYIKNMNDVLSCWVGIHCMWDINRNHDFSCFLVWNDTETA